MGCANDEPYTFFVEEVTKLQQTHSIKRMSEAVSDDKEAQET